MKLGHGVRDLVFRAGETDALSETAGSSASRTGANSIAESVTTTGKRHHEHALGDTTAETGLSARITGRCHR